MAAKEAAKAAITAAMVAGWLEYADETEYEIRYRVTDAAMAIATDWGRAVRRDGHV
jgi:hypothetical protein